MKAKKKTKRPAKTARETQANNPLFADRGGPAMAGETSQPRANVNPSLPRSNEKGGPHLTPFPLLRIGVPKGRIAPIPSRMLPWQAERLRDEARRTIADVTLYADGGDVDAVALLVDIAAQAIGMLRGLAQRQPELVRPYARKCFVWPDLIGTHPGAKKWNEWLLDELQVGAASPERGGWQVGSPATQQAIVMFAWLKENQAALELPNLTQSTREEWFRVGWQCLLKATGGKPERDEFLAPIGEYRRKHSELQEQARAEKGTAASNVRDGIKEKIHQCFLSVTKRG